jgi:tripartite-type tricarboxylate transporter receptor subunit TctC
MNKGIKLFWKQTAIYTTIAVTSCLGLGVSFAQGPEAPKTITVYVPSAPGGSYDLYGRLLSRHLGRHLPGNPNVVASHMPGGSGIVSANFLYNHAPKDGSAIAIVFQTMAEEQALAAENVQFDVKKLNWIGRVTSNVEVAYTWHTSAVKTIDDAKQREMVMAAGGPAAFVYPAILNKIIGTKFRVIRGYQGTKEMNLAMERGEVEGTTSSFNTLATTTDWLTTGKLNILVQYAPQRHPSLPNIPTVGELVSAAEDKELIAFLTQGSGIGRSFAAPPGTSLDRVEVLRTAFEATMKDAKFIAEINQAKAEFDPLPGAVLQRLIESGSTLSALNVMRAQAARKEH